MAKTTALKTKVTFIITTKDGNKEVRQLHIKGDYTYANILEHIGSYCNESDCCY
jgi:hypothetical protein